MHKENSALNNLQCLICHKTKEYKTWTVHGFEVNKNHQFNFIFSWKKLAEFVMKKWNFWKNSYECVCKWNILEFKRLKILANKNVSSKRKLQQINNLGKKKS